ncbi:membrane-associated protein, putative [Bodo saltans]|uniref:Membrane-associated protein, putative n=1 Tax=Bodo saltans TaxID=75058 RepID=A0A0S4IXJ1_BODSA|nr:membrane-associated protein, putative [Bodo saltans]|eukprot:CUG06566.1 membrane-associated protein, putative [Bodo saltans]
MSPASEAITKLTSAIVTLLSSGAALLQQSRADSLGSLASCQFSLVDEASVQDSPTQLGFGSELQHYYRGTVVGNFAVIFGFTLLVAMLICASALCCRKSVAMYSNIDTTRAIVHSASIERLTQVQNAAEMSNQNCGDGSVVIHEHHDDEPLDELVLPEFTSMSASFFAAQCPHDDGGSSLRSNDSLFEQIYRRDEHRDVTQLAMLIFEEIHDATNRTIVAALPPAALSGEGEREEERLTRCALEEPVTSADECNSAMVHDGLSTPRRPRKEDLFSCGERKETYREALKRSRPYEYKGS